MKSCRPMRAKTLRQNKVRIMTSDSFFTDWISAPTIVFRPKRKTGRARRGEGHHRTITAWVIIATRLQRELAADKSLELQAAKRICSGGSCMSRMSS